MKAFQPFIAGLVLAVGGTTVAVILYFVGRFRLIALATAIIIAALILYKVFFIPT